MAKEVNENAAALDTEAHILRLGKEIEALNEQIRAKRIEMKALEEELETERLDALIKAVKASGRSYDEIMAMFD